jgi:hypothetical protein
VRKHVDDLSRRDRFDQKGHACPRGRRGGLPMTGIEDKCDIAGGEPLDDFADGAPMEGQIDDGGSERRRFPSPESGGDGIGNRDRSACRREGLLKIESDKRLVFNDENVLASKHSSALVAGSPAQRYLTNGTIVLLVAHYRLRRLE